MSSDEGVCIDTDAFAKLAELRRAMRLFGAFSERISRSAGLSALEYQALLAIRASSRDVTQSLLSRELALGWRATSDLTKRLAQSCLVAIETNAPDRRYRRLVLTDRGHRLLAFGSSGVSCRGWLPSALTIQIDAKPLATLV